MDSVEKIKILKLNVDLFAALLSTEEEREKIKKIRQLVTKGASVFAKLDDRTPLQVARELNENSVAKYLAKLENDAKLANAEVLVASKRSKINGSSNTIPDFTKNSNNSTSPELTDNERKKAKEITKSSNNTLSTEKKNSPTLRKGYFIGRTLINQNAIKQEILERLSTIDSKVRHNSSATGNIWAKNEEQFKKLCRDFPNDNVHLLTSDRNGLLIWQKTRGSLDLILEHIDVDGGSSYLPKHMDKMLKRAERQKIVLMVDQPGMGKTIMLAYAAHVIKRKDPRCWVSVVDLGDFCGEFNLFGERKINEMQLCKRLFQIRTSLESAVFESSLRKGRTILMLDGFDEVCPLYKGPAASIIKHLKTLPIQQLWVTCRPSLKAELVDRLEQLPIYLKPFTSGEQIKFLIQYWRLITLKGQRANVYRLKRCAETLIKKLTNSISDKEQELTGIPLQTKMLAVAYCKQIINVENNNQNNLHLPDVLNLFRLFKDFFSEKFSIHNKKIQHQSKELYNVYFNNPMKVHRRMALETIFPNEAVALLDGDNMDALVPEELARFGIVYFNGHKFSFVHRTFAEYLVAWFFSERLRTKKQSADVSVLLIEKVLVENYYEVIRRFFDGFLEENARNIENAFGEYGETLCRVLETQNGRQTIEKVILKKPLWESNSHTCDFLLTCLKMKDESLVKIVLIDEGINVGWNIAASRCYPKPMETMWNWSKAIGHSPKELLMQNVINGNTIFHWASCLRKDQTLDLVYNWARSVDMDPKEFLSVRNTTKNTLWHMVSDANRLNAFKSLFRYIIKTDIRIDFFGEKNNDGENIWHVAALRGNDEILRTYYKRLDKTPENIAAIFNERTTKGNTVWHLAAERGNEDAFEFFEEIASLNNLDLDRQLVKTNIKGSNPFHLAVQYGHTDSFRFLWNCLSAGEDKREMLSSRNHESDTVWHLAAVKKFGQTLDMMWRCATEVDFNFDNLLFETNKQGVTAWQAISWAGYTNIMERIWSWAVAKKKDLENLLLSPDRYGFMMLHVVAMQGRKNVLKVILGWFAKAGIDIEEVSKERNLQGETIWHIAAYNGHSQVFNALWSRLPDGWKDFLTLRDRSGNTVWHLVVMGGHEKLFDYLLIWCRKNDVDNKEWLTLRNGSGHTAWLMAAEKGYLRILKTVLKKCNASAGDLMVQKTDAGHHGWDLAAASGNEEIFFAFLEWLREAGMNIRDYLDKEDVKGFTVYHLAASGGNERIMGALLEMTAHREGKLNELLKNNVDGWSLLHFSTLRGHIKMMELLWSRAHDTDRDLVDLLIEKNSNGDSLWHLALFSLTDKNSFDDDAEDILNVLKRFSDEVDLPTPYILLDTNEKGQTIWHITAIKGHRQVFRKIWSWIKESKLELTFSSLGDAQGNTAQHYAAHFGELNLLEYIRDLTAEAGLSFEDFLTMKNHLGHTVYHVAAVSGYGYILRSLQEMVAKEGSNCSRALLEASDVNGNNIVHHVALANHVEVLEIVLGWASEVGCVVSELLFAENKDGNTPWSAATFNGNLAVLDTLRRWTLANDSDPVRVSATMRTVFTAKNNDGFNLMSIAMLKNHRFVFEALYEWAVRDAGLNPRELLEQEFSSEINALQVSSINFLRECQSKMKWDDDGNLQSDKLKPGRFFESEVLAKFIQLDTKSKSPSEKEKSDCGVSMADSPPGGKNHNASKRSSSEDEESSSR